MIEQENNYKWYILTLVVLTNMFVIAIPAMGMSVMAKEIAQDLHLSVVQVGVIWGIGSIPGIFTSLLGGLIGDKLGPKRVLAVSSLIAGLLGAARSFVPDFLSMVLVVILAGALIPFVSMNGIKTAGQWFPRSQLGLANGLISMGMALGFLLGSLLSATTLSPLLGGWRNVLLLYGLVGALFSIPWMLTRPFPQHHLSTGHTLSIRETVPQIARLKDIWLLGFVLFGVGGAIQGLLGYLPLYLLGQGWSAAHASGALSAFHTSSMLFVLPFALWSDRLGSRKNLLLIVSVMVALGTGVLSFASGGLVWVAVLTAGFVRDAFMAIYLTMVIETDGVGPMYAGTATGFVMTISSLGNVLAPPIGNSLAVYWSGAPFVFWASLVLLGMVCLSFVKKNTPMGEPVPLENPLIQG